MTPAPPELPRVLGLWDATCVVIGAIVGVGIFFTPRGVADVTGSAAGALLAWGLGGAIALLGALTFAELGRLRPVAGGQYLILRDAFGRAPAFLFVFCNLTAVQAGAVAIIAIVCAQNLGVALHGAAPSAAWVLPIAAALVGALAVVNVAGVRGGAGVQDATVVVKLLVFAALVAVALGVRSAPAAAAGPAAAAAPLRFAPLFTGVTLTLFAYGGWQQALWMAGETREAPRTVPRAILLGVGVVVLAYLSANWAYLHLLGLAGVRRAPELAADAFSVASPDLGRRLAAGAVAISAFGVLNAQLLSGPRLTWAMAREGQFFAPFARLLPRAGTPAAAILLLAGLGTALALGLGPARTDALTAGVVVVDATFFALTGLALPVLRRRAGRRAGWRDAVAVVFAALELLAIAGSLLERDVRPVALSAIGWMGAAGITWAVWFRRRGAPAAAPAGA